MKTSILISSLVSIAFSASIASANETTLNSIVDSALVGTNTHQLTNVSSSSQVIESSFHLAMMDEKEDMDKMDKMDDQNIMDDQDNMDKKDKMKNKGDMKKMHDKDHMHKMHDKDKMKSKNGMDKKGNEKKGTTSPSSKKPVPNNSNAPPAEMPDTPAKTEPAPMNDM